MRKWWIQVLTFSLAVTVTTATAAALSNDGGPAADDSQPPVTSLPGGGISSGGDSLMLGAPCVIDEPCPIYDFPKYIDYGDGSTHGGTITIDPGEGRETPGWGNAGTGVVWPNQGSGSSGSAGIAPDPVWADPMPIAPDACDPDACRSLAPIWAAEDLARYLGVDPRIIQTVIVEQVNWPDGSLGNPQPGYAYTDAIEPGYRIELAVNGHLYVYHTDMRGNVTRVSGA